MKNITLIHFILLILVSGCASSKITSSWKQPAAIAQKPFRIMVIGLMKESDRSIQENMENHLVADLEKLGYTAVSSFKEYGPNSFKKGDTAAAILKLKNSGVDAVLTIVLLDKDKEQQYVSNNYRNQFYGYRYEMYMRVFEPGYYVTNTSYFWESNFYNLKSSQLIYSVQTKSFNPDDVAALAHEYGKMIVKDMVRQKVISQQ